MNSPPRDYSQDIDAMLIAKPVCMTVESLVMFQDHIGKPLAKSSSVPGAMMADSAEVDEAQDKVLRVGSKQVWWGCLNRSWHLCLIYYISCFKQTEEQLSAAEYAVVCASLAADFKEAVAYNLRVNKAGLRQTFPLYIFKFKLPGYPSQVESNKHVQQVPWLILHSFATFSVSL